MVDQNQPAQFPADFDQEFAIGHEGNRAYIGRNVLRGLVAGIDDFSQARQGRWNRFRSLGPVLLGSAMWLDDPELIDKISELSGACVVVTKQGRTEAQLRKLDALVRLNEQTPGMPIRAFWELSGLAPRVDGKPTIVGPSSPMDDTIIPTIRTLGYRRLQGLPPIIHAKLALLGHMWWHDEGPLGHVDDVIGFAPMRLWVSSANFTRSSRRNLEFGYWTEDPELLEGARRFLVAAMRASEGIDPTADTFEPDLSHVEFDEGAMAEALAELQWEDGEDLAGD